MADAENEGCQQYLPNELCGFTLGPANNEPCYLMRRRVGWLATDEKIYIKWAKLPNVLKYLSRLNACGDKVIDKKFCNSQDKTWVWEATAFRQFRTFEGFVHASPPYVISYALGADGIIMVEQEDGRKLTRQRFYKDRTVAYEMKFQNFDTFTENQVAEKTHSWGPNGALLPWTNSSREWRSCLNENSVGIICFFNELWLASYNFSAKSGSDYGQVYFDVLFRPRQISRSELMLYLFKSSCGRPCGDKETVLNYPCISGQDYKNVNLPEADTVGDTDQVTLPSGTKVTGKDYKAKYEKRSDYVEPCIKTCKESGTVSTPVLLLKKDAEPNPLVKKELGFLVKAYTEMYLAYGYINRQTPLYTEIMSLYKTQLMLLNKLIDAPDISEFFKRVYQWSKNIEDNVAPILLPQFRACTLYVLNRAYTRRNSYMPRYEIKDPVWEKPQFELAMHSYQNNVDWYIVPNPSKSSVSFSQVNDEMNEPQPTQRPPTPTPNPPDVVPNESNKENEEPEPSTEPMEESTDCDTEPNDGN